MPSALPPSSAISFAVVVGNVIGEVVVGGAAVVGVLVAGGTVVGAVVTFVAGGALVAGASVVSGATVVTTPLSSPHSPSYREPPLPLLP